MGEPQASQYTQARAMLATRPAPLQRGLDESKVSTAWFSSFYSKKALFDSVDDATVVTGNNQAILALTEAISTQGQSVDASHYGASRDAFVRCLDYLQRCNAFPHSDDPAFNIGRLSREQLATFGITSKDFYVDRTTSVRYLTSPPMQFENINLDYALAYLRVMSKYHHGGSPDGPRVYQIGVVTRIDTMHHAQLFNSTPGSKPTHTIWILREIIGDPEGVYVESWHPFVLRPGAPEPPQENFRPAPPVAANRSPRIAHAGHAASNGHHDIQNPTPPCPAPFTQSTRTKKPRNANRLQHDGMPASDYQHLTIDEILDGSIDPDELAGGILLEVNKHFTYKEITNRLNTVRTTLGRTPTKQHNTWKRIKTALEARATAQKPFGVLKDEIEQQREINKAARGAPAAKQNKSRSRGRKRKSEGEEEGQAEELRGEGEKNDVEERLAPSGHTRATPQVSNRVNYALKEEVNFDGETKDNEDDDEGDKLKARGFVGAGQRRQQKRRRTVKLEESDGD